MKRRHVLAVAVLALVPVVGCADRPVEPDHPTAAELSGMNREQMMLAGQNKIAAGQTMQSRALLMGDDQETDDGQTKSQMMDKARGSMDRGRAIVQRAEQMPPTDPIK